MSRRASKKRRSSSLRLTILRILLSLMALVLIGRLFTLQILDYNYYSALASVRHNVSSVLTSNRGMVYVQDKSLSGDNLNQYYPVALNKQVENLIVSPHDIGNEEEVADVIADITGEKESGLINILKQDHRKYWLMKKDLDEKEVGAITKAKEKGDLPRQGIWFESKTERYYPEGNFLSHVLGFMGFVGDEQKGVYGLERQFQDLLAGEPGRLEAAADAGGNLINGTFRKLVPAENGASLVLTVERAIQSEAERVLEKYIERFSADGGTVIVADPKTGAVLAMASRPSFNVNEFYKEEDIQVFSNPSVQARYEPGSVIKPLTMAAALESDSIEVEDTYEDKGGITVNGHIIKNSDNESHGIQSMSQVLEKSLNTGIVYVQQQMPKEVMVNYFKKFGLNQETGINLPAEIPGDLRNLNSMSDIAFATAAFGQGISVTPVELVRAYTALANGGEMKRMHIISEIHYDDGTREIVEPQTVRRVISSRTAAEISSMLVDVVERGHGQRAAVSGYFIAGKTGTAQVPLEERRGYDPDKTIGSFIGFGPVENPAFIMLVKIDNPKGIRFAESTVAPAFGEIAEFILNYLQVPPTRTVE